MQSFPLASFYPIDRSYLKRFKNLFISRSRIGRWIKRAWKSGDHGDGTESLINYRLSLIIDGVPDGSERIDLNQKWPNLVELAKENRWNDSRGNRFPYERVKSHKSLARDSACSLAGLRPTIFFSPRRDETKGIERNAHPCHPFAFQRRNFRIFRSGTTGKIIRRYKETIDGKSYISNIYECIFPSEKTGYSFRDKKTKETFNNVGNVVWNVPRWKS